MNTKPAVFMMSLALCSLPTTALALDPFEALGTAGDYTLLGIADAYTGTASGFMQLGSAAHVYGDVGARWRIETAAGVVVDGDAHYGTGGSLHGGSVRGSNTQLSESAWASVQGDAWAAVEEAFALDATPLAGSPASACQGAATSSGSVGSHHLVADRDEDGLSVYEFDGCLYLGDGETITIEGTPDDRFVIRVTGGLRMDGGSAIVLDGLPGSAVMFVFDSGGWASDPWAQVTVWDGAIDDGAELSGVFLAPWMYWQLGDGTLLPDTRILAGGVQANIQDMHSTGPITGSPIEPEEEEEPDDTCEDHDRPIWGERELCPPRGSWRVNEDDSTGGSGHPSDSDTEDSFESGHETHDPHDSSDDGGSSGKGAEGCTMLGLEAGGLAAGLSLLAVGVRRRRDD